MSDPAQVSRASEAGEGVKLHRCRTPWKFGPCWRVQKALEAQGIPFDVVPGPWRPKNRTALIEGTGQPLYPAIRFEDGSWYREESKDMARTIDDGRLDEQQGRDRPAAADAPG